MILKYKINILNYYNKCAIMCQCILRCGQIRARVSYVNSLEDFKSVDVDFFTIIMQIDQRTPFFLCRKDIRIIY